MSRPYLRSTVQLLSHARDTIDSNLSGIKDYLEATGVGYRGKLVDNEGYPLANIDHFRILQERQRAARLINDRKRVEFILEAIVETEAANPLYRELERYQPFAIFDEVFQDSPAEKAGLSNGDFILKMGSATRMADVQSQVIEGEELTVAVLRVSQAGRTPLELKITPATWSGTGLIGAHILPYPE
jgi:26S proteasome non-ATPase regulatory subunit 9